MLSAGAEPLATPLKRSPLEKYKRDLPRGAECAADTWLALDVTTYREWLEYYRAKPCVRSVRGMAMPQGRGTMEVLSFPYHPLLSISLGHAHHNAKSKQGSVWA